MTLGPSDPPLIIKIIFYTLDILLLLSMILTPTFVWYVLPWLKGG